MSIESTLSRIYPACHRLLGDEFFDALARRYVIAHPSMTSSSDEFGEHLPMFMTGFEPLKDFPFIPELATLEWHWHRAFHALDEPLLSYEALKQVTPEDYPQLRFQLAGTVHLLPCVWKLVDVWRHNRDEAGDKAGALQAGPEWVVISRREGNVEVNSVSEAEFIFLASLKADLPFGTFCERLVSKLPEIDVSACLLTAIQQGWINGFTLPTR